jgi:uncharacterized protein (DUF433 family)
MERQSTHRGAIPPPPAREHIITRPGYCGGKPHIAGHRIKVQHIAIWHDRLGKSPDEIIAEHPGLTLADVYAALAYYDDHREEIDADIEADDHFIAEQKAKGGRSKLQEKLAELHGKGDLLPPG